MLLHRTSQAFVREARNGLSLASANVSTGWCLSPRWLHVQPATIGQHAAHLQPYITPEQCFPSGDADGQQCLKQCVTCRRHHGCSFAPGCPSPTLALTLTLTPDLRFSPDPDPNLNPTPDLILTLILAHLDAAPCGTARVVQHSIWRAVRRHDSHLRRHPKVLQHLCNVRKLAPQSPPARSGLSTRTSVLDCYAGRQQG